MPEIVVHHLERSRSHRVLWLLEELGLEYEMVSYQRDPRSLRAPPELREVHALGKSPVITIDGEVYAESGAILEALVERGGDGLRPEPGTPAWRRYRYFMHYGEGSLMPPLLVALIVGQVRRVKVPFFIKPITRSIADRMERGYHGPELERHGAFLEAHLQAHAWFVGDAFTVADVHMSYPVEAGLARGFKGDLTALRAWHERITSRPAYKRALERGGPVMLG